MGGCACWYVWGLRVGMRVGLWVGMGVGMRVGMCVGMRVGMCVGLCVGMRAGLCVGVLVCVRWCVLAYAVVCWLPMRPFRLQSVRSACRCHQMVQVCATGRVSMSC